MLVDKLINTFDAGLRAVFTEAKSARQRPDQGVAESDLTDAERNEVTALMRINHVGEVCAQALYSGQAFTSKNPHIVASLAHAACEETDHLAWCETRIEELGGRKSILNPLWYASSFTIGAMAGAIGDQWNLGFLAETEKQVGEHLAGHLQKLPNQDKKSRAIIEQMHEDETSHAQEAQRLGAAALPPPVKLAMKCASKVMTSTAYYF